MTRFIPPLGENGDALTSPPGQADFNCIYQAFFVKSLLQQLTFEACVDRATPGSEGISLMCSDNFVVER